MFRMSLNRVHDRVKISEGDESLTLVVDGDANRMVAGIGEAVKVLKTLTDDTDGETKHNAARYFAEVIFGAEQADKLMAFYRNDPVCVINLCGKYISTRLSGLIAKAQKKAK